MKSFNRSMLENERLVVGLVSVVVLLVVIGIMAFLFGGAINSQPAAKATFKPLAEVQLVATPAQRTVKGSTARRALCSTLVCRKRVAFRMARATRSSQSSPSVRVASTVTAGATLPAPAPKTTASSSSVGERLPLSQRREDAKSRLDALTSSRLRRDQARKRRQAIPAAKDMKLGDESPAPSGLSEPVSDPPEDNDTNNDALPPPGDVKEDNSP